MFNLQSNKTYESIIPPQSGSSTMVSFFERLPTPYTTIWHVINRVPIA
jgi:hypothetical protein